VDQQKMSADLKTGLVEREQLLEDCPNDPDYQKQNPNQQALIKNIKV
jgi:hypothetical protein